MFPDVYTDEELMQIELPTLLLIGAGEKIYNPKNAIARAQRLMPDLTAEIIPSVGHTLNMEQPDIIDSRILEFLSSDI
jgi:pimeloyl-ACP methyl ester carboxylesterase